MINSMHFFFAFFFFWLLLFASQREKNHGELGKTSQNMLKT